MTDTVTTGKRGRKSSVILTDRLCDFGIVRAAFDPTRTFGDARTAT
jgi:hypothetical protein